MVPHKAINVRIERQEKAIVPPPQRLMMRRAAHKPLAHTCAKTGLINMHDQRRRTDKTAATPATLKPIKDRGAHSMHDQVNLLAQVSLPVQANRLVQVPVQDSPVQAAHVAPVKFAVMR